MRPTTAALLLLIVPCTAMRIDLKAASRAGQTAALSALCSACLLNPLAANAGSLDDAILEVSQTSYPIIKALDPKVLGPFSEKVGKLILDIKPEKLGKSLELGIDVFNSVPDTTVNGFKGMVKEAFSELKTDTCTLVPLPSQAVAFKFQAVATERVEESKLKAFNDKWGPTLGALSKTEDAICLPPPETLPPFLRGAWSQFPRPNDGVTRVPLPPTHEKGVRPRRVVDALNSS